MKKQKTTLIPFSGIKKRLLRNLEVKKAYSDFDFEFQIIETLIKTRAKKGMTQEVLAKKIGVTQSALARFESGKINPTISFLGKVTQGLGLKLVVK
ncbi:MAG: helix-turn-helix domain-containing protein [Minisyncoccota bacterium]